MAEEEDSTKGFGQRTDAGSGVTGYALATFGVVAITVLARPLHDLVEPTNLVMIYLLLVVGVAVRFSRGPAAWSALLGVLAFDFFYVPPRLSFVVGDVQYLLTFAVMLFVGLLSAHLTDGLRRQAMQAVERESATKRLYELARELAGSVDIVQVAGLLSAYAIHELEGAAELWWAESGELVSRVDLDQSDPGNNAGIAPDHGAMRVIVETVMRDGKLHERADFARDDCRMLLVPLDAPMRRRGVLVVRVPERRIGGALRSQLSAVAVLVAIALERLHYVRVAQRATLSMERERLRGTILSALSHDIRTPLTVMVGQADALQGLVDASDPARELVVGIRDQALRMSELTDNLLDMARLQSGQVIPRIEWQSVEEIVGAAVAHLGSRLDAHRLGICLPQDLPLVEFDAVLMERVLSNLIDNAVKYTPAGTQIRITAEATPDALQIVVADNGPGLPGDAIERLFEPFVRGDVMVSQPGLGLGLSICRIIVEAHGGVLSARNLEEGGACFIISVPRRSPPPVDAEDSGDLHA